MVNQILIVTFLSIGALFTIPLVIIYIVTSFRKPKRKRNHLKLVK